MSNVLLPGQGLTPGNSITSPSGRYELILQSDGNLVVYDWFEAHRAIWASNTGGHAVSSATMQTDGNFVIYGFPNAIWASNTAGDNNAFLVLQDDGNLVIYRWIEEPLWASGTAGQ
jgi:hypothetical protein